MARGRKRGTETGGQTGPVICDRGQVRVGTRFALNDEEIFYLPGVRRRVCKSLMALFFLLGSAMSTVDLQRHYF